MDNELIEKVMKECKSNLIFAEKRLLFLRTMPKSIRPIEYQETLESWEFAIKKYKNETSLDKQ